MSRGETSAAPVRASFDELTAVGRRYEGEGERVEERVVDEECTGAAPCSSRECCAAAIARGDDPCRDDGSSMHVLTTAPRPCFPDPKKEDDSGTGSNDSSTS